ncbi:MAG: extracellular solute-binding protein [Anaerolineae bacterium]
MFSRRDFLKLMGVTWVAAQAGACSPFRLTPDAASGNIQLVYEDFNSSWFPPMAQELLAEFHRQHPEVSVFYVPDPDNVVDQMPIDMQAGTAPDVFQGCCTHFPDWAQKGFTLDLRPYVERDLDAGTIADWDPVQYHALFAADGRQYGLPKYHGALALYYNKDIFDTYHVDYPNESWTQGDYREAMVRLTHDANGDGATDLWGSMMDVYWDRVQVHVNAYGGHFVDPQNATVCRMGEPEALAAVEWLRARIWDDRVMATLPDVDRLSPIQAFIAQRVAMVEDGSWSLKTVLSQANFRLGIAPLPPGPVRRVTLATTDGFGI